KHKFASQDFNVGDEIYMYGVLIGKAIAPIKAGQAITTQNVVHASAQYGTPNKKVAWNPPNISKFKHRSFLGYPRVDGSYGTANYWLVIPLTFCENRNVDILEAALLEKLGYQTKQDYSVDTDALISKYKKAATVQEILDTPVVLSKEEASKNRLFPNVDGVKFLRHDGGCGGTREDAQVLCNLLAGYISNPNVAGATVLSLGCQNAQIEMLQKAIATLNPNGAKPVSYLEQQQSKSERDFIAEAVKLTFVGLMEANKIAREPAPLSQITLGLECGGSDGFSGISANPALGYASDLLTALGGSPVLAEFPELNGVEQNLIDRCQNDKDAKKFASLMKAYSESAIAVGSGFESNPSPGNIKDGLITDAMKSAGAA
ncbi:MAG: UxaA family hydrolase, partial [Allomuricauda sp.]